MARAALAATGDPSAARLLLLDALRALEEGQQPRPTLEVVQPGR